MKRLTAAFSYDKPQRSRRVPLRLALRRACEKTRQDAGEHALCCGIPIAGHRIFPLRSANLHLYFGDRKSATMSDNFAAGPIAFSVITYADRYLDGVKAVWAESFSETQTT